MRYADNEIYSCSGSPIRPVLAPKVKTDGSVSIEEVGKENFDAYIQSFKDSTDIAFILAKLNQGDTSVLHAGIPSYGDFTKVPKSFAEVLQLQIDAGRAFDRLPSDVRAKFNNDVNMWLANSGTDSWYSSMEGFVSKPIKDVVDTVSNESEDVKE